jgi:Uma2 family endonuclease
METTERVLSDYERERGKPMPSLIHSITQKNLIRALLPYEPPYLVCSELTLRLDEEGDLTPDVSVLAARGYDYTDDEVRVTEPPPLTIEIQSPTQSAADLARKIRRLLTAGVQSAWLVVPPTKTVTVYPGVMEPTTYDGDDLLRDAATGIDVALPAIFAPPPAQEA